MNNFNDYYSYMLGNPNYMNNNLNDYQNNTSNFDNKMFNNTFMNTNDIPKLYNPSEGLIKGNMFANLYEQYKNYKPAELKAKSERENLLNQIRMYKFALTDLNLYLDLNPKNIDILKLYNDYLMKEKELVKQYEHVYGPLCSDTIMNNNWTWNNSPWSWEVIE